MADASLTLAGLFNYDNTIFDDMALPVRPTPAMMGILDEQFIDDAMLPFVEINKETLIGKICLDSSGLSVMHMNAATMKMAIKLWSKSQLPSWQALYNTLFFKYNPLWNKDAFHTENVNREGTKKGENATSSIGRYETEMANNDRNTGYVRGFDQGNVDIMVSTAYPDMPQIRSTDMVDDRLKTIENDTSANSTLRSIHTEAVSINSVANPNPNLDVSVNNNTGPDNILKFTPGTVDDVASVQHGGGTNSSGRTGSLTEAEAGTEQITWTEHGNIGVTMTQELIEKARNLALFNLYDVITKSFIKKFCIMVY